MMLRIVVLLFSLASFPGAATTVEQARTFAVLGEPKYAADFHHYDYVNPDAPKGGSVTLSQVGTFDNFNRFALRGNAGVRTESLYDSLFTTSDDEPGSYYPLIAVSVHYASDFSWADITMNPQARFHDGSPIRASDMAYTFHKFMTEGVPQFRLYYKGITIRAIAPLTVRIALGQPNKDKLLSLLTLPVMPKAFWQHHKLSEPLATPPLASGPYKISDWRLSQYIVYSRVKDYWGANLPVNRGRWNFDTLRYDYYLDDNVAFEAFKAGAFDLRAEPDAKNWATRYIGRNFTAGYIIKEQQPNTSAQNAYWLAFNVQRPLFSDRKVREALSLAFDFEWMNKALFYNAYSRANSYFQNTEYAARSYPSAAELALLTPMKTQLPPEVFTRIYQPPVSDGGGFNRANLLQAAALLKESGWVVKNRRLVNIKTGQPFNFEILVASASNNQWVMPFQRGLARLGISATVRQVDNSQLTNRLRSRDFDMMPRLYRATPWPDTGLQISWASEYIDSSYNTPGVKSPVVDALVKQIVASQGDKDRLLPLGRALDRVLTWNNYMIPMWYMAEDRLAWWNKFSHPATRSVYSLGLDTWWYDAAKAATLPEARR